MIQLEGGHIPTFQLLISAYLSLKGCVYPVSWLSLAAGATSHNLLERNTVKYAFIKGCQNSEYRAAVAAAVKVLSLNSLSVSTTRLACRALPVKPSE